MNVAIMNPIRSDEDRLSTEGATVALRGVTRSFGDRHVLRGVDLEIGAGEAVAIVGRSGCGKSTLLRLIAGLDEPTSGTVAIDGRAVERDLVRLMFQEPRLLPWQRVLANAAIGLPRGTAAPERGRLARDVLAQVGLAGREGDWPAVLSGGQKQRVALARALAGHPGVLALDEPLGALDALTRIEMQSLIDGVWRDKGFTMIVVTHDVSEAVMLADRILLVEDGRIAMDVSVRLARPRRHGDPEAARIEGHVLDRLLRPNISPSNRREIHPAVGG
jgi:sulfonate transport system ATP-binding protein